VEGRVGQSLICSFAHHSFPLFSKERLSNRSLICSFKRANERSLFLLLFAKEEQMSDCSFFALFKRATKRAIALLLFQKE